ncbi:FBP domain-containing protein [Planctomonas deserti]|uniref:FBP domain-containing protein n=1 Tax=Planctomonas deserti TaxID=2144185 RepID=UPI000D3988D4|nr:FBP domain-containing protein [Planctomonas deserti]
MNLFSEDRIRASFVNASLRERKALVLPANLDAVPWQDLDYLGWRDPKLPLLGYVLAEIDGEPVGVLLRQAQQAPRGRAQCSWCEDVQLPSPVTFFGAKRAGEAGRSGNTVGTLVCANFECSVNVRRRPTLAYVGFDLEAERLRRIEALRTNVTNFVRNVRDGA